MRILHLGKFFAPFRGGVETYLLDVLAAQQASGHDCAALVHQHDRSWTRSEEAPELGGRPALLWRSATWARAFFTPLSPAFGWDLAALMRTFQPDVIHVHLPNPSACWLLALAKARKTPLVVHWHSDVITDDQGLLMRGLYRIYRRFERALLRRADAIVATSPSYLETSESLANYPEKCHVVPLGLDPERVLRHDPRSASHDDGFRVLAVGRLTYYKGFGFLLRAVARLDGVSVHIVGEGDLADELRRLAAELDLGDRVRLLGGLDDAELARELRTCDCLCLPSIERTEAFGLVLLEAMAFGRAAIASRVRGSGMAWVVEDGITGLTVPPRDSDALASAIERLRDDPALVTRLGSAGRARFEEQFSIERSAAALDQVYEQLPRAAA